jgi:hypothetical protein
MKFVVNDGGRKDAGFKGDVGDCVCRSITIITEKPYKEVYDALNEISKEMGYWHRTHPVKTKYGNSREKMSSSRTGHMRKVYEKYLFSLGYKWIPTMKIGSGCKVHLKADELPNGRLIVAVSRHITAVIDGVIYDTYDCSRKEKRCVYGYYIKDVDN